MILFENLKTGDKVFIVLNTGLAGISEHQYIGIFTPLGEYDKIPKHVFLNGFFNNLVAVTVGRENKSHYNGKIFYTEAEAQKRLKQLRIEEQERREED